MPRKKKKKEVVPLVQILGVICKTGNRISEYSAKMLVWLILALIFVFCWEVLLRGMFNAPTIWAHEGSQYIFGVYFALGGAYALKAKSMVNVDIFVNKLSPRTRAIIDVVTAFITFLFLVAIIWKGLDLIIYSIKAGERSSTAWSPIVWPIKITVVIGTSLLAFQALSDFIRNLTFAISGKDLI